MKLSELFESNQFLKSKEEIEAWLKKKKIEKYTISSNLTVDVNGDVDISHENLKDMLVQFGRVTGDFDCHDNNLTSLVGAPREVSGDFNCWNNKLTALEGAPREVGKDFICHKNNLTSLEGTPREVGGDFICWGNEFKEEPDHSFIDIGGNFKWK